MSRRRPSAVDCRWVLGRRRQGLSKSIAT